MRTFRLHYNFFEQIWNWVNRKTTTVQLHIKDQKESEIHPFLSLFLYCHISLSLTHTHTVWFLHISLSLSLSFLRMRSKNLVLFNYVLEIV